MKYLPRFSNDGSVNGFYIFVIDETERKLTEEALRHLNENLEERVAQRTQALAEANQRLQNEMYERIGSKFGSSRNTGEGCADFQEEVFLIPVAVSPALDDLDGVVDAFDDTGIKRVSAAGQDAVQIGFETLSE